MRKRMILMLTAVVAFLAIIGGVKFFQVKSAMAQGSFKQPPETVTTTVAKQEEWATTMSAIGTVAAVNGVTVSADLPGIVDQIPFTSGNRVNRGDVLVRLQTTEEKAQLAAAEAQLHLAGMNLERSAGMVKSGVIAQASYDQSAAELKGAQARVGEIRASIERKTIRAPFSGVLGIRQINLGQYLNAGAPIVSLQSLQPVYVNFTVPQQELAGLTVGKPVEVTSDGFSGPEMGKLTAIDSIVDEAMRNVRVQAVFDNRGGKLHPGMFVQANRARGGARTTVITLPTSAISYAPFGDSVFIVEQVKGPDGKSYRGVRQQFVKLGAARGDQVAVLTGIKPGEQVVTSGVFKLRPGAAVEVNNSIQPGNSPAPKPEDS
ncbi:MAG TPA: efflux RND transporter periplasmic adaptor subunit [Thermoanaerobaculia bacterium]|nr:efflux RND transporter periplasmic adaptor subunit [Thermoanaerobaculia bacterium]